MKINELRACSWTVGEGWPNNGEIDIIEGVNRNTQNAMALHTKDGCSIDGQDLTGSVLTRNCYVNAPGQSGNQGCSQIVRTKHNTPFIVLLIPMPQRANTSQDSRTNSYGDGLNQGGGGVYAMEWNAAFIKVWYFPRGQIPADALGPNPEPYNWGTPAGHFQGNCNINNNFNSHRIIFDITFCGDWAGNVWGSSGCQALAGTCNDYVSWNAGAFAESYWRINR